MKAILVLGLLVAVCFAGAGSAATHPTAAENKREAKLAAARLLALFVPPPGATRLRREPVGDQGFLRTRSFSIGGQSVYRHAFWRVDERLASVVAFVKAHPPNGVARLEGSGRDAGEGVPANRSLDFVVQQRPARWLEVTMAALSPGSTGIRVDASAGWIIPRSPSENVPDGVREIDIRRAHVVTRLTQPATVQTIVRWFDALGIVQGGRGYSCPALLGGRRVTLDFRSASRTLLARASLLDLPISTECNPIGFSIRGRSQTPLVGLRFWNRVKRLVGLTTRS